MGLAASAHASHHEGPRFERHRPEETVLYRVVAKHWPAFRERVEELGPLPRFVVTEFEAYGRCGRLEHGFLRVLCGGCGFERLVAFSCKRRGFCPSCLGRRMSDIAVHLTEHVLPEVPLRQWVCSLPWGLRVLCGYHRELCAAVISAFVEELLRSLRWRAKRELGLASVDDAHPGAITFIQRFDSALRMNVHAHTLALDGVYVQGDGPAAELTFHALSEPTDEEVLEVAQRTAERVAVILKKHARSLDGRAHEDDSGGGDPALASCYDVAARAPAMRVVPQGPGRTEEHAAVVMGFNVHAGAGIDGRDRQRVERVCRYLARPPIAQDRLEKLPDGKLRYEMKKAWRDGTRFVVFEPHELIARLCAMVPPPWFHMMRVHGVLAPNATLRKEVVSSARPSKSAAPKPLQEVPQLALFGPEEDLEPASSRKPWSWLLAHVFSIDVTVCPRCGGDMKWVEIATTPEAIADGLARAGLRARAPPREKAAPLGQLTLGFSS